MRQVSQRPSLAFGLSEKSHGADIYSTDMVLTPDGAGWRANGRKYYIGNGNEAAIVSTFGRVEGSDDYVFFASDPAHDRYNLIQNVVASQNYVSEFELDDYPVREEDILALETEEKRLLARALKATKGNVRRAAHLLQSFLPPLR